LIRAASLLLLVLLAACSARTYEITHTGDAGPPKTQRGYGDIGVDGGGPDFRGDGPPVNPDAPDGCAPRPEQCNGLDDNCNGLIDEDFNLNTDPQNCGTCGKACSFANATAVCSIGKCKLEACKPGFVNLDKLEPDGCE
jgi:hypothetical protein